MPGPTTYSGALTGGAPDHADDGLGPARAATSGQHEVEVAVPPRRQLVPLAADLHA